MTRIFVRFSVMVLASLAAACAASPRTRPVDIGPIEKGPGSTNAARKFLEGRWSLQSYEVFPPGQPPIQVKGSGTLLYDAYGNLDIEIRTDPETARRLEGAGIQTEGGVLSTSGRTVVDMQHQTLTYVIEGQPKGPQSGPLGLNRPRHWTVEGNVLTLTTQGDDGKPVSSGKWEKMVAQ
jgi:hypothetical protein